jgi:integration host factor subunit beta
MAEQLARGERIEIRGLGSFSVYYRAPHRGINPQTGTSVLVPGKFLPRFRPGKELRERVDIKTDAQSATSEPSSLGSLQAVER